MLKKKVARKIVIEIDDRVYTVSEIDWTDCINEQIMDGVITDCNSEIINTIEEGQ